MADNDDDERTVLILCFCEQFKLWYTNDDDVRVCHCGHPRTEHMPRSATCIGESILVKGVKNVD